MIRPPALDDRSFQDLVEELIARIPAHTPEWTHHRAGDPGRTLLELFAWLTDTLLYRANLIPERQRLVFLDLLGVPLRPAAPARGIVTVALEDDAPTAAVTIKPRAQVTGGSATFETQGELTVLPLAAQCFYKRPLTSEEAVQLQSVVQGLEELYQLDEPAEPYVTTPVFVSLIHI